MVSSVRALTWCGWAMRDHEASGSDPQGHRCARRQLRQVARAKALPLPAHPHTKGGGGVLCDRM
eukprot:32058-Eustigmatos_ZCMA.PRE.1